MSDKSQEKPTTTSSSCADAPPEVPRGTERSIVIAKLNVDAAMLTLRRVYERAECDELSGIEAFRVRDLLRRLMDASQDIEILRIRWKNRHTSDEVLVEGTTHAA